MNGKDVLGIIFANTDDDVISDITGVRSMASVPYGGSYRLIDFALSSMVNAGMSKVGIVTNNNYQSLMDHIGTGKPWDLARKTEGIFFLPPFNLEAVENYNSSRIGALKNITRFLEKSKEEYVFMADSTFIANLDLTKIFKFHTENGYDITQLYRHGITPDIKDLPILDEIEDGRIVKMSTGTAAGAESDYALKAIVLKKSLLESLVNSAYLKGEKSFEKDVIVKNVKRLKVGAYEVTKFCRVIDSLKTYEKANFDLLEPENYKEMFCSGRKIYTKVYDDMPSKYGLGSDVANSLIADGCVIEGEVRNSIISRGCRIEKGAVVENCILMPHTLVAQDASIKYVITDKNVTINSDKTLYGTDTYPIYVGKNIHV